MRELWLLMLIKIIVTFFFVDKLLLFTDGYT